ncbi:sensor histidine kinase [Microlunatus speluncae]|uniref:sensor histidine kinase n=1 Tax=Microlunatus speluncae TaxID=2594267 RepID=UPI00126658AD|nr:histidine kinase [Microlunatus speluncae]
MTFLSRNRAARSFGEPLRSFTPVAVVALAWVIITLGGFSRSVPTMIASSVAILALVVGVLGSDFPRRGGAEPTNPVLRWLANPAVSIGASIVQVLAGAALCFELLTAGWAVFSVGVINIVGKPLIRLRYAMIVAAAGGVVLIIAVWLSAADHREPLWSAGVALGVIALGYSRRQRQLRRQGELDLVERSREVVEQTEKTRAETERAAVLEERNRIARDMHDLLAHSLGGLVVQLDAADAMLAAGRDPATVAERIRTSRRLAVDGLREARLAVRELRNDGAGTTADTDLAARLIAVLRGPVGVQLGTGFEVVGDPRPVPGRVAEAFAAVTREAITNINKHAPGARSAATLVFTGPTVRLELINSMAADDHEQRDDGDRLAGTGSGLGVAGMRHRLAEIGGAVTAERRGDRWLVSAEWTEPAAQPDDQEES